MASITTLRQNHLNLYLHRTDGNTRPWTDAECDQYLTNAIVRLWPELGVMFVGDVLTDSNLQTYTLPAGMEKITRIDVMRQTTDRYIDRIANFTPVPGGQVVIKPPIVSGLRLRFVGYRQFSATGSDLPVRLESVIAARAAHQAWSALAGELLNSQRQQNLDSGRVVSYGDAAAQAAYWEGRYQEAIFNDPDRVAVGPRAASR